MARKQLIRTDEFPYHITARSNNRESFSLSLPECWEIFNAQLFKITEDYQVKIVSFVLMSNHFHLILMTPLFNVDSAMQYLMREVSRTVGRKTGRINHIFGGRYKWCLIEHDEYFSQAYRYVYRNPVEAKIVDRVEDYPFSTLQAVLGRQTLKYSFFDCIENSSEIFIPKDLQAKINWLNEPYVSEKQRDFVRRALRRTKFSFSSRKNDQKWRRSLGYQK